MRGAERPGKVNWNRPFFPPLEPLCASASRRIFIEVADEPESGENSALNDLLDLSGSLPLAVSLMASIASFEGYSNTLARWETENTALLSVGPNRCSNLEKSITLSLSSPRMSSSVHAKNLLSLLAVLPDGISAQNLIAGKVPIPNVLQCQSMLLGTSLAYKDPKGRLKVLGPVREYIRRIYPPPLSLCRPLRTYFRELVELWSLTRRLPSGNLASELVGHLGNISQLIVEGLMTEEKRALIAIGHDIITLDVFSSVMLMGESPLMQRLPHLIEVTGAAGLRWKYAGSILQGHYHRLIEDPDSLIEQGVQYFNEGGRPVREGETISARNCHHTNLGE